MTTNNQTYKYITNKIDNDRIKYSFVVNDRQISYKQFINLLKSENKDFYKILIDSLKNANSQLSAYFWECPPVSKETINKEFEFVVTKSEGLNNITQNRKPFKEYINNNHGKYACNFPNLRRDATLIIPIPKTEPELDFKNISKFTENAPLEQQQGFWRKTTEELVKILEENPRTPKWLSTHGLGVHYLHLRIDNSPRYYNFKEYKIFDKNAPIPNTPKEKILQNLDKICIDPFGNLANAELLKDFNDESFSSSEFAKKGFYKVKIDTGEEVDLNQFRKFGSEEANCQEIKQAIFNSIKQNASDWEIKKWEFKSSKILRNKKTGVKHWEDGIAKSGINWEEIEESIKNSQTSVQQPNSQKNDKFPFLAKLAMGVVIFVILTVFLTLVIKRNKQFK